MRSFNRKRDVNKVVPKGGNKTKKTKTNTKDNKSKNAKTNTKIENWHFFRITTSYTTNLRIDLK